MEVLGFVGWNMVTKRRQARIVFKNKSTGRSRTTEHLVSIKLTLITINSTYTTLRSSHEDTEAPGVCDLTKVTQKSVHDRFNFKFSFLTLKVITSLYKTKKRKRKITGL